MIQTPIYAIKNGQIQGVVKVRKNQYMKIARLESTENGRFIILIIYQNVN
jgi:hypothetical protein